MGTGVVEEPVGRQAEQELVARMLESAVEDASALVIEGEPGIGKTRLWRWAVDTAQARGFHVLRARPAPTESKLAFAALGDLVDDDVDEVLSRLPAPQQAALAVALLRRQPGDSPSDLRAVSVAFLSALRFLSRSRPVLLAVDDVQWLDSSTRRVLAFAARRVGVAAVSFLVSLRSDADATDPLDLASALPPTRLHRASLGPMTLAALHHVIRSHLGKTISRASLTRVARTSGGNPFYAIELARALEPLGDGVAPGRPLPITASLRTVLRRRLSSLPAAARWSCLLAAAATRPDRDLLSRAANATDVDDALASGILVQDRFGAITFLHPLFAAAIYDDARPTDRQRAHRRLAELVRDPEERGRLLALAADGPDRRVAKALDVGADRARRRGATDAAAQLAQLACDLTPASEGANRARRCLAMARDLLQLGDTTGALAATEQAIEDADGSTRANALLLRARVEWLTGSSVTALAVAEEALATTSDALQEAGIRIQAAFLSKADRRRGLVHARRAVAILEGLTGEEASGSLGRALAAVAFVECDLGKPRSSGLVERALALASEREGGPVAERVTYYLGSVLWQYDDLDAARPLLEDALRSASEEGDEGSLSVVLDQLSQLEVLSGDWAEARRHASEQRDVSVLSGQEMERLWGLETLASIDAREGKLDDARARIDEVLTASRDVDDPMTTAFALRTSGFVAWSLGDLEEACTAFDEATEIADGIGLLSPAGLRHEPDHAEALIELGRLDESATVIERLRARGRRARLPWARVTTSRCLALLAAARSDLDSAMEHVAAAVREQRRLSMPFELARTSLVKGRIHRRRREKRAARDALDRAASLFDALGAAPWAGRARAEADRLGLRPRLETELTSTEQRVAHLAASGLSNPEISSRLFMSRKTVEFNLGKVYRKLGVRSRTELASRLQRTESEVTI